MPVRGAELVTGRAIRGFRPWQEFVRASFPGLEVDNAGREFRADVTVRACRERSLAVMAADDCRVTRTVRWVNRANAGHLKIMWQRSGTMAVEQDGRRCRLGAGMVAICDTGRPYRLDLGDAAQLAVLTLPYDAIPGWQRLSPRVCGTPLGDRVVYGAALAAALHLLEDDEDHPDDAADRILVAVQLMLSASLHRSADSQAAGSARSKLDLVQQHILSRIDDPDLGPHELAAALHVSRRTLYGLFKGHALTPSALIRDIRLKSVRAALADGANSHRSILELALAHGFTDNASFCRIFKAAFEVSPSVWRARALPIRRGSGGAAQIVLPTEEV